MTESMLAEPDERSVPHHTSSRLEQQVRTLTERVLQLKGELAHALARVAALTTIDDTTGLLNWRALAERAHTEIARATRYQREIGLALFALAEPGPLTLRELAEICRSKHRECDLAGQTERGEIVLLLPETSLQGALVIGQRIRGQVAKGRGGVQPSAARPLQEAGAGSHRIASEASHIRGALRVGCASWPQHGRTLTALLSTARNAASVL